MAFEGLQEIIENRTKEEECKRPRKRARKEEKTKQPKKIDQKEKTTKANESKDKKPDRDKPKKEHKTKTRTPEDRKLIALLVAYGRNEWLGPYLKNNHGFDNLEPAKLRKLKPAKLQELLEDVEQVLANKTNDALGNGLVRGAMYNLEHIVDAKTSYKIVGTTDKCFENDHWRFLLERCKMKYKVGFGTMDPVAELSLVTFQSAAMMHYKNLMETPTTDLDEQIPVQ